MYCTHEAPYEIMISESYRRHLGDNESVLQDASLLFKCKIVRSVLICMHLNCDIAKCRLALPTGTGGGLLGE